jgi:hypothetical protein
MEGSIMRVIKVENDIVTDTKKVGDNYLNNPGLQEGEEVSDIGEIGQIKQPDGTFITPELLPIEPQVTLVEQIYAENLYQTALLEMQQMLGGM